MANIPISQIVQINPRVIGAGGAQSPLDGLLLTKDAGVAPSQLAVFYTADDVAAYFGASSAEATAASTYFAGVVGGGQQPASLTIARFTDTAAPAAVFGARTGLTLSQLQALSGTLVVTTDTQRTSSAINLSTATSFADAAAKMTAGFTTPNFAITYDAQRGRFVLATTATGAAASVSAVTGTLATGVGLSTAAGAFLQPTGVDLDTAATAMARVTSASRKWGAFTTAYAATLAQRTDLASWTSANLPNEFIYVAWDTDVAGLTTDNAASFGAQVFSVPYQGTIPVYGTLQHAAGVLAWAAATNYDVVEGRNTLAFRTPSAGVPAAVSTLADANALLSNNYTYLGAYTSSADNDYTIYYNGALSGQFNWADTYLGQIWLRRTLQQALFEVLLAYNTLPYNTDGYNAIWQGAQDTIQQALANGVIRAGVTLSASQQAQINTQAGQTIADIVSTLGWYLQVRDPLTTSVRTERGSPVVNFWYSDGGSIQRISVSSTTVL